MSDINSVTEGRVTVTANDTADNIREAAGFAAPEPEAEPTLVPERDEAGKFKPKAETPIEEPSKTDGDPRKSYQAKINQAIAKQREAERKADEAERRASEREAELQALRRPLAPATEPAPVAASAPNKYLADIQRYQSMPDAPKFEEFVAAGLDDPYTVHQAAMAAFITDKRRDEWNAAAAQEAQQRERSSHLTRAVTIASERHTDFGDLIAADTRVYPDAVAEHLKVEASIDPELSAELLHHLLTHPDDADRLATMVHPIAVAREVGRLIAGLSSAPSGPETGPVQTMAKPLIKPVRPSVMARDASPPDDLAFGPEYIRRMNERERKDQERRRA